jgi:hypothetical protein
VRTVGRERAVFTDHIETVGACNVNHLAPDLRQAAMWRRDGNDRIHTMPNRVVVADDCAPRELIAERAYEKWQQRGCPRDDGRGDWLAALAELEAERENRESETQL